MCNLGSCAIKTLLPVHLLKGPLSSASKMQHDGLCNPSQSSSTDISGMMQAQIHALFLRVGLTVHRKPFGALGAPYLCSAQHCVMGRNGSKGNLGWTLRQTFSL